MSDTTTNQSWQVVPDKRGVYSDNPTFELAPGVFLYARTLKPNERWTLDSAASVLIIQVGTSGTLLYTESTDKTSAVVEGQHQWLSPNYAFFVSEAKVGGQLINSNSRDETASFVVFVRKLTNQKQPESLLKFRMQDFKTAVNVTGKDFVFSSSADSSAQPVERRTLETLAKPGKLGPLIHVQLDLKPIPGFSFSTTGPAYGGSPAGRITIARVADYSSIMNLNSNLNLFVLLPARAEMLPNSAWRSTLDSLREAHVKFFKNKSTEITLNALLPGETIPFETHTQQDQIVLVVGGALEVTVAGWSAPRTIAAGDSVAIPAGMRHELANRVGTFGEKVTFISIYAKT